MIKVKVLNVGIETLIRKFNSLHATYIGEEEQAIYVYDLPTIYSRYIDILDKIETISNDADKEVVIDKIRLLFFELNDILTMVNKDQLIKMFGYKDLKIMFDNAYLIDVLPREDFKEFMMQFKNNSNKWVRIRKCNHKVTIAIKHKMFNIEDELLDSLNNEIEVESLGEAINFIEGLGFTHRCYQEKKRITYELNGHYLYIDEWPEIPAYFEFNANNEEDLDEMLELLGFTRNDIVSKNAMELFNLYGKNMFSKRELIFKKGN